MKFRHPPLIFFGFLASLLILFVSAQTAIGQSYLFEVPELRMQVFVQPDASAKIVYDITFANQPDYSAIDIVDIGTPHDDYDLANFSASINGVPLNDIRVSEFIDTGVEIHLNGQAIPAGQSGTLHVEFTMPDMVYEDTTQADYASLQFTPTWFDPSIITGSSNIWLVAHMLPEINPNDVLFQDVEFTEKTVFEEHAVVGWRWPSGLADRPYLVGVSFPTTGMTRVVEQSLFDLVQKWLVDNPEMVIIFGLISLGLFAFAFFRMTGGTGFSVFVILAGLLIWLVISNPTAVLLLLPVSVAAVGFSEWRLANRKEKYLPAIAQVEGGGIKRGLTAPEAGILLELPLNKVLLLVIFGLLDKGAIKLEEDSPLRVSVQPHYVARQEERTERKAQRQKTAQEQGIVLRSYEHRFLDVLQDDQTKPVHKLDFTDPMKALLRNVVRRMKGFDLSDTQDYYRKIIAQAMQQAGRLGEIPEFERHLDKTWPWIFLDDGYDRTFRRRGYEYRPIWVRPYIMPHGAGSAGPSLPSGGQSGPSYGGKTSFGDVAASFAGWTENTAGKLADTISPTTLQVEGAGGGIFNLSGADKVTGDVFKALASSSGGSGGSGGSGCACACAGCACACACAGGGR